MATCFFPQQQSTTTPATSRESPPSLSGQKMQGWHFVRKNHQYIPVLSTFTGLAQATVSTCIALTCAVGTVATATFSIMAASSYLVAKVFGSKHAPGLKNTALLSAASALTLPLMGVAATVAAIANLILAIPIVGNLLAFAINHNSKSEPNFVRNTFDGHCRFQV